MNGWAWLQLVTNATGRIKSAGSDDRVQWTVGGEYMQLPNFSETEWQALLASEKPGDVDHC